MAELRKLVAASPYHRAQVFERIEFAKGPLSLNALRQLLPTKVDLLAQCIAVITVLVSTLYWHGGGINGGDHCLQRG